MEAVQLFMNKVGEGHHEDYMRAFFRLKLQDIGSLLPIVNDIVDRSTREITQNLADSVPQANEIILVSKPPLRTLCCCAHSGVVRQTILQSALDYRNYNQGVYGIELPLIEPWTGQPAIIDVVSDLFDMTAKLVESQATETGPDASKAQAKAQLPELGMTLFACYSEWLQWLESPIAQGEPLNQRERADLDERFRQSRPVILETLREFAAKLTCGGIADCWVQGGTGSQTKLSGLRRGTGISEALRRFATRRRYTRRKTTPTRVASRRTLRSLRARSRPSCISGTSSMVRRSVIIAITVLT